MQQRNFWLFLFLSAAILLGWAGLQMLFPPPESPKKDDTKTQAENKSLKDKGEPKPRPLTAEEIEQSQIVARLFLAAVGAGGGQEQIPGLLAALDTAVTSPKEIIEAAKATAKPKTPSAVEEAKTVVLGGDGYYLNVLLTTRGAGVQKLTFTRFYAATTEGRPAIVNGKPVPLDLIPDDPIHPSFVMYHYADPDVNEAGKDRPDTTLGDTIWELESDKQEDGKQTVVFTTPGPPGYEYLKLRKIYTLHPEQYHIDLKIEIEDVLGKDFTGQRKPFRYQLAGAHGLPIEGIWYTGVFRNAIIGMVDKNNALWRTFEDANKISFLGGGSKVPGSKGPSDGVQYAAVATQFFTSAIAVSDKQVEGLDPKNILSYARAMHESQEKICYLDGSWDGPTVQLRIVEKDANRTMPVTLLPRARKDLNELGLKPGDQLVVNVYSVVHNGKEILVAGGFRLGTTVKPFLEDISVCVVSEPVTLDPRDSKIHQYVLYHGPTKVTQLSYVSDKAGPLNPPDLVTRYADTLHLNTLTDYPSVSFFAWWSDLIIFFTRIMHWMLNVLFHVVPIEGVTIILLTVIVRGLMFPISRRQAMTAMRMQELGPEMRKIQEKYKNDVQARNQAMMELYRKHNVNPLGGCLPLVMQLPIFLGLYFALQESIRFRLAPFLWVENLAAPDMLFYWGPHIPIISDPDNQPGGTKSFFGGIAAMFYLGPYFNLLPVVAVVIMLISQKMMMPPAQDEQQEMQQKMMTYMMVFIGIMFYKVAAGLSIYFIATTLWGIAERRLLPKKKPVVAAPTEPSTPTGKGAPGRDGGKLTPAQQRKKRGKTRKEPEQPDSALKKVRSWWEEVLKQAKKK